MQRLPLPQASFPHEGAVPPWKQECRSEVGMQS